MLLLDLDFLGTFCLLKCHFLSSSLFKIFVWPGQRLSMSFWQFSLEYIWVDDSIDAKSN